MILTNENDKQLDSYNPEKSYTVYVFNKAAFVDKASIKQLDNFLFALKNVFKKHKGDNDKIDVVYEEVKKVFDDYREIFETDFELWNSKLISNMVFSFCHFIMQDRDSVTDSGVMMSVTFKSTEFAYSLNSHVNFRLTEKFFGDLQKIQHALVSQAKKMLMG